MIKLSDTQRSLLLDILRRRAPQIVPDLTLDYSQQLTRDVVLEILDQVTTELCDFGFNPDSEPNEYGLVLETLTGALSLELQKLE